MLTANKTRQELVDFETGIAEEFNAGKIRYPVHLESGNEDALIGIFKSVKPQDWIFGSWRLHLKALLKGVPPEELRAAIHRGESMALRFDEYRVYGSAIAGGTVPIALGTALAIKRTGVDERVWCFLGDMTACTGIALEAMAYSGAHKLPLRWIVEDNGMSVCTSTSEVWNGSRPFERFNENTTVFSYLSKYPHAGAGTRVEF